METHLCSVRLVELLYFVAELPYFANALRLSDRKRFVTLLHLPNASPPPFPSNSVSEDRVARLKELDRFDESADIIGMAKTRVQKISLKKKKKVKKAEEK